MIIKTSSDSFRKYQIKDKCSFNQNIKPLQTFSLDIVDFKASSSNYNSFSQETIIAFWKELKENKGNFEFKIENATFHFQIRDFDEQRYKEQTIEYTINNYSGDLIAKGEIRTPRYVASPLTKNIYAQLRPDQYEKLSELVEKFIKITKAPRNEIINNSLGTQENKMVNFLSKELNKDYPEGSRIIKEYLTLKNKYKDIAESFIPSIYEKINERY